MKMPPELSTDQALRAENAELRARLEDAEEMLRAIRAGEVDALVVEGDAGPRLFTLQGLDAEQSRLRGAMLAQVSDAVITTDREDRITFLNPAAEQQYRVRSADMLGRKVTELYTPQWPTPEAEAAALATLEERGHWRGEKLQRTRNGRVLPVEASIAILHDPETGERAGLIVAIRDITERHQAESAQRLASERLTLAVQCSQVVLWQQDLELRYTWLQNAAAGFEEPVAIGKRDADLMERAADAAVAEALKREVIRSGISQRQEIQVQIAGVVRCYDLLVEPQRDAAGLIFGVTCAAIDITERKRAEEARHEMERNYRALAAASSEVAYRMSADWSTMLPLDGRQLVASSDQPLADWAWLEQNLPRDEHPRVRQAISDAIARKTLFELEHRVRRPDGSTGWTLSRAVPILDENKDVIAWFGAASDITARKQAEEALARLAAIVESSHDALFGEDLDGIITSWNPGAEQIFGYRADEIMGTSIMRLIPDAGHGAEHDLQRQIVIGERGGTFEATRQAKDGRKFHASITVSPMKDAAGKIIGSSRVIRDITERELAADRLREATEKAVAANAAKDRFLAVLSHELRTPLTPVLMTAEALEHDRELRPDVRESMAMIRRNIEMETNLIDDLLDVSRIASGKLTLRTEPLELNAAVLHVCSICRPQLLGQEIQFTLDLCKDAGFIMADPARFKQVIWNVLNNAVKFTPQSGAIHVSSKRLSPTRVEIRVTDNGAGIPPDTLPRIFDAFEQGDARITREFGGLGLGLAISKALIELHGGTIRAESPGAGRGSTFTIELPGKLLDAAVTEEPAALGCFPTPALRLLIVEDHSDTACALKTLLSLEGFAVTTAATVADALAVAKTETFDILVSDLGLPDATGYELMTRMQDVQPLPGIAMSGYGMEEDVRKSHDAGFSEHLVKPMKIPQLIAAIRRLVAARGDDRTS